MPFPKIRVSSKPAVGLFAVWRNPGAGLSPYRRRHGAYFAFRPLQPESAMNIELTLHETRRIGCLKQLAEDLAVP